MVDNWYSETDQSASFNTTEVDAFKKDYTVLLETSGTFNIDVKLQSKLNNEWVDIEGSSKASITAGPIQWDVNTGRHYKIRVAITVNSGTVDTIEGYINNGY